jgi:precorrin-6B methylase 2
MVLAQTTMETPSRRPDVHFVPTPEAVVAAMLEVAKVSAKDVLYDLGSGDGRIPITAAKKFGTRGVGIDIDPERIKEANESLKSAGVTDKVRFIQGDLFEQDLSKATVITLYLLPELNLKLRPTLLKLKPGTRIVSHDFDMGDWKPQRTLKVGRSTVYLWRVPRAAEAAKIGKATKT